MASKLAAKVVEWADTHPVLRRVIWYGLFPITFPLDILSRMFLRWFMYRQLDKAIAAKNENAILKMCASWLKFKAARNEWKYKISKKWFAWTMRRYENKLYNYSSSGLNNIKFDYFRTLIDVYLKYNIIGGGRLNTEGSTTITIGAEQNN